MFSEQGNILPSSQGLLHKHVLSLAAPAPVCTLLHCVCICLEDINQKIHIGWGHTVSRGKLLVRTSEKVSGKDERVQCPAFPLLESQPYQEFIEPYYKYPITMTTKTIILQITFKENFQASEYTHLQSRIAVKWSISERAIRKQGFSDYVAWYVNIIPDAWTFS